VIEEIKEEIMEINDDILEIKKEIDKYCLIDGKGYFVDFLINSSDILGEIIEKEC